MKQLARTILLVLCCSVGCGATTEAVGGGSDASIGATEASLVDVGSATSCTIASDCIWGEIDHEILAATDCVCLYGCPYLPMNQTTAQRRRTQYDALCNPRTNGNGQPCGIDDCAMPPTIQCAGGVCRAGGDF
jgi:hypothetical protein